MAETRDRRKTPRKPAAKGKPEATPKPDSRAAAPRPRTSQRSAAPLATSNVRAELSPEETRQLIAEAAYYRAKRRNFEPGHELEDWIEAESEVMGRLQGETR